MIDLLDLFLHRYYGFFGFVDVEFQDTGHFNFRQSQQIIAFDLAYKILFEGLQPFVDMRQGLVHAGTFFESFVFVDPFFDKNLFEGRKQKAFEQFTLADK